MTKITVISALIQSDGTYADQNIISLTRHFTLKGAARAYAFKHKPRGPNGSLRSASNRTIHVHVDGERNRKIEDRVAAMAEIMRIPC